MLLVLLAVGRSGESRWDNGMSALQEQHIFEVG